MSLTEKKRKDIEAQKANLLQERARLEERADKKREADKRHAEECRRRKNDTAAHEELEEAREALAKAELRHKNAVAAVATPNLPGGPTVAQYEKDISVLDHQIAHLDDLLDPSYRSPAPAFHTLPPHKPASLK